MKRKKLIFLLGLIVSVSLFVGGGWKLYKDFYLPRRNAGLWAERARAAQVLRRAVEQIEGHWFKGDQEGLWERGELACAEWLGESTNTSDIFLRCNPGFIQCLYGSGRPVKVDVGDIHYNVSLSADFQTNEKKSRVYQVSNRFGSDNPFSFHAGIRIKLQIQELPNYSQEMFLEDSCHEAFLPQRKYAYGSPTKRGSDFLWDSVGRLIVFDRYLVTERDVREWADFVTLPKELEERIRSSARAPALPSVQLLPQEMQAFCQYKGKTLMSALVFDAASFFPLRLNDPLPEFISRGPYPWGHREKDSFVYKIIQGDTTQINQENCQMLYAQECASKAAWKSFSRDSSSFAGLFQILGGVMEYLDNPLEPELNLKVSSVYFPFSSAWHRLGVRGHWDGEGHSADHFSMFDSTSGTRKEVGLDLPGGIDYFEVGFRCMREVAEERQ
ncbi:MAG: hypothetical protein A2X86_17250 [Bdellovibrionales bacterium GWA2_49_15]|nr:MAG: hypothetical protein A2X86_17250 [Bdellovibrionales bacterium GWA2_49_15]HAZ14014.1 hypothetical protein [Bdellovibrionales bacterium]